MRESPSKRQTLDHLKGTRPWRRSVVTLIGTALIATSLAPVAVRAEPGQSPAIVLEGNQSGWIDVTFTEPVTPLGDAMEIEGGGDYVAFLITKTSAAKNLQWVGGGYASPPMMRAAETLDPVGFFSWDPELAPGTYRIHLITDEPVELRIPTQGLSADLRLEPRHSVRVEGGYEQRELTPGDTEVRRSVRRRKGSVTIMAMLEVVENHQASAMQQCLLPENGEDENRPCEPLGYHSAVGFVSPLSVGKGWAFSSIAWAPDFPPPGIYQAVQRVAGGVATAGEYHFLAIDVDLTSPSVSEKRPVAPPVTAVLPYDFSGVDGVGPCGAFVNGTTLFSCNGIESRWSDRYVDIDIEDTAGGPVAAKVHWDNEVVEICGSSKEPIRIPPETFILVQVFAHPTAYCTDGRGSNGQIAMTFSRDA